MNTVSRRFGISTLTSLRLFTRAPCTRIRSWLSAACSAGDCVSVLVAMLIAAFFTSAAIFSRRRRSAPSARRRSATWRRRSRFAASLEAERRVPRLELLRGSGRSRRPCRPWRTRASRTRSSARGPARRCDDRMEPLGHGAIRRPGISAIFASRSPSPPSALAARRLQLLARSFIAARSSAVNAVRRRARWRDSSRSHLASCRAPRSDASSCVEPRRRRMAQRSSWMRIRLPAGSRKAQSRTPYGCSVGSWTTSASLACSRSKVPSRSVVARRMLA